MLDKGCKGDCFGKGLSQNSMESECKNNFRPQRKKKTGSVQYL